MTERLSLSRVASEADVKRWFSLVVDRRETSGPECRERFNDKCWPSRRRRRHQPQSSAASGARILRRDSECCWTRLITTAQATYLGACRLYYKLRTSPPPSTYSLSSLSAFFSSSSLSLLPASESRRHEIPALIPLIEIYRENYGRFRGIFRCVDQDLWAGEEIRRAPNVTERNYTVPNCEIYFSQKDLTFKLVLERFNDPRIEESLGNSKPLFFYSLRSIAADSIKK